MGALLIRALALGVVTHFTVYGAVKLFQGEFASGLTSIAVAALCGFTAIVLLNPGFRRSVTFAAADAAAWLLPRAATAGAVIRREGAAAGHRGWEGFWLDPVFWTGVILAVSTAITFGYAYVEKSWGALHLGLFLTLAATGTFGVRFGWVGPLWQRVHSNIVMTWLIGSLVSLAISGGHAWMGMAEIMQHRSVLASLWLGFLLDAAWWSAAWWSWISFLCALITLNGWWPRVGNFTLQAAGSLGSYFTGSKGGNKALIARVIALGVITLGLVGMMNYGVDLGLAPWIYVTFSAVIFLMLVGGLVNACIWLKKP